MVSLICLGSCEDVLDLEDPSSPTSNTFFQSETELEIALAGVYESLNYVSWAPFPQLLDECTDYAFSRGNFGGTVPVTTGSLSSTDDIVVDFWNRFYTGIQRANNLLSNMDKAQEFSDPARFAEIRAETLFLRAMFYSYLTELYGDVPFRTEVTSSLDNLILPKTPKADIVAAILVDLEESADVLPQVQPDAARGRASADAAKALISRIALYNGDYALAAKSASAVINSGNHSLFPDYKSLFTVAGVGSSEVLLDLSYTEGTRVHALAKLQGTRFGGWCAYVPAQQTIDSYETINGLPIDEDPMYNPASPFENRDPRLSASIVLPGSEFTNFIIQQHSDSIATWRVEGGVNIERVFNVNSANPAGRKINDPVSGIEYTSAGSNRFTSFTGYFWRKYSEEPILFGSVTGTGADPTRSEQPIYLMRYAEVLLNYAEANIEAGTVNDSVVDVINQIRERAYNGSGLTYPAITTTDPTELRKIVRRERKVELANEGLRLFDIRRWQIAEKVMNTTLLGSPANGFSKVGGELRFVPVIDDDGFITYLGAPTQPRQELGNLDFRELEVRSFNPGKNYFWPIPQAEIDASGGVVTQNPGY
ncbi:RagB/SusD family nutrient uptake outer membrane protein [Maribacter sp. Asnod2-G09]|uniref:RagB/SusD family nutrient uptake outer membrane protein n=1 Tax=Maribacter sp. Asnod2-G09 TaxID=3160577 RepID=UPI0038679947